MKFLLKRSTKIDEMFGSIYDSSLQDGYSTLKASDIGASFIGKSWQVGVDIGLNLARESLEKNKDIYVAFHDQLIVAYFVNDQDQIIDYLNKYIKLIPFK